MTTFKRYFVYRLKQSILRTLVFTVLSVMICLSVVNEGIRPVELQYKSSGIEMLAVVLGVFCTLIPILELSGFKNRRNLDTLYFFPIKRVKMALAHYLSGALQVLVIYTVSFISVWLTLLVKTDDSWFRLEYMPLYYVFSLILGAVMYSIFAFLFSEGNTVADGVLFCGLWVFILYLVMFTVRSCFLRPFLIGTELWSDTISFSGWGIIYAPINNLTVIFQRLIDTMYAGLSAYADGWTGSYAARYLSQMYMFFIWLAVGIAAAFGYFLRFSRRGAHMAGEVSDSPFGFKLLIPLYGYTLLLMYSELDIMTVIIFALMLIGYCIYRRGFKIKKSDIIFIACGILPMILSGLLDYYSHNR